MSRKRKELPLLRDVTIEGVAAEGNAIARILWRPEDESKIVLFVPYGAPGDVADIQVRRKKHSYAQGEIVELKQPSEQRVRPRCRHFGLCGGCKWQHLPYDVQLEWKQRQVEETLRRIGKVEMPDVNPILGSSEIWHYRNKMEYTFSNKKWRTWDEIKSGKEFADSDNALGFHIPGAFDKVLHIEECMLQLPVGDEVRNFLYDLAEERGLSFYDIKANKGLLRTLMLRIASTGEMMICVSFGEDDAESVRLVMDSLAERFPEATSLVYTINLKLNDSISDQKILCWKGREYLTEEMEGLKFRVNAKSFYQTNSRQAYELYKTARRMAGLESRPEGEGPLVYDLYTGTGTIANFVARNCRKVVGIEYVPEAIEDARLNASVNNLENTLFFAGDMKDILTDEFVKRHGRPEVMIIDPPRAGMHEDVVNVILNAEPDVLVYVSCNPSTQARDLGLLDVKYRVTEIQPVDMFPHTHHVENVVRLELRK